MFRRLKPVFEWDLPAPRLELRAFVAMAKFTGALLLFFAALLGIEISALLMLYQVQWKEFSSVYWGYGIIVLTIFAVCWYLFGITYLFGTRVRVTDTWIALYSVGSVAYAWDKMRDHRIVDEQPGAPRLEFTYYHRRASRGLKVALPIGNDIDLDEFQTYLNTLPKCATAPQPGSG